MAGDHFTKEKLMLDLDFAMEVGPTTTLTNTIGTTNSLSTSSYFSTTSTTTSITTSTTPLSPVSEWVGFANFKSSSTLKLHRGRIPSLLLSKDSNTIFSVSQDLSLKIYDIINNKQVRSMKISQLNLSSCGLSTDEKRVYIGCWDNHVYVYSVDYSRIIDTVYAHDDAVSCMHVNDDLLVTGSWDATVRLWKATPTGIDPQQLADLVDHESEVRCVQFTKDRNLVVSGASDGKLVLSDIRTRAPVRHVHAHTSAIISASFCDDGGRIISSGEDNNLKVFDIGSGVQEMFQIEMGEKIRCSTISGDNLLLGCDDGLLRLWNLLTYEEITQLSKPTGVPVCSISVSEKNSVIVTGDEVGTITVYKP